MLDNLPHTDGRKMIEFQCSPNEGCSSDSIYPMSASASSILDAFLCLQPLNAPQITLTHTHIYVYVPHLSYIVAGFDVMHLSFHSG